MRLPDDARFDAVVVGGGVYGVMLALEGAVRGQRILLIERRDFGGETTFNHLRTIHGGLRYLQFLDFPRAVVSNRQRMWWLQQFPDLIEPISCLMPLYGEGLRRPAAFRMAFVMAKLLGMHVDGQKQAREIGVISPAEVRSSLSHCRMEGLQGGAVWQDAFMPRSHRVVMELLHWAEANGVVVRNRMELVGADLVEDGWRANLRDRVTGEKGNCLSGRIINATGPACDAVVKTILGDDVDPILVRTLAWGLLIDRPPVSRYSVAATPPQPGSRTYFVHPYHGRIMAGTGHMGIPVGAPTPANVPEESVASTIDDLNQALPGFDLRRSDVKHVFHGILPGTTPGSDALLMHPHIVDHGRRDGAAGLWTVLGVKFTEAPFVARRFWDKLIGRRDSGLPPRPAPVAVPSVEQASRMSDDELMAAANAVAAQEWCVDPDDLLWRRSDLWLDSDQHQRLLNLTSQTTNTTASDSSVV